MLKKLQRTGFVANILAVCHLQATSAKIGSFNHV